MTYTLVTDGSSDRVLLPILTWSIKRVTKGPVSDHWADYSRIPRGLGAKEKLKVTLDLYPCDLLFIHRDAEAQPPEWRRDEIAANFNEISTRYVAVVPVRMTEAWLLFDEPSIRHAAGNPNGTEKLGLPEISEIEEIADPKTVLHDALIKASGRATRRLSSFSVQKRIHRIPEYIDDYSVLECLPAFSTLQQDIWATFKG